jgi:hypothetical protein
MDVEEVMRSEIDALFSGTALSRSSFLATTAAGVFTATMGRSYAQDSSVHEAVKTAIGAYIYGYSLVTTDITRLQMSNVSKVEELHAPLGAFFNVRGYPPATYRGVSGTNADTLYSVAWLDLKEPMVFSHPEVKDRFFTFELVDLWMTVHASVGTNTTGSAAETYLFTGPGWDGEVPEGMIHMAFPTRYMCVLGRTYALDTPEDLAIVHKLQDQYKVEPLAAYGKPYTFVAPPLVDAGIKMDEKPQKVILGFGVEGYFNWMTRLIGAAAVPASADAPMLAKMAEIGIVPGQKFELSKLDSAVQDALKNVPQMVTDRLNKSWANLGKDVNGWRVTNVGGRYGTDYLLRATWASNGWPSQLPEVSVYPTTYGDCDHGQRRLSAAVHGSQYRQYPVGALHGRSRRDIGSCGSEHCRSLYCAVHQGGREPGYAKPSVDPAWHDPGVVSYRGCLSSSAGSRRTQGEVQLPITPARFRQEIFVFDEVHTSVAHRRGAHSGSVFRPFAPVKSCLEWSPAFFKPATLRPSPR